MWGLVEVGLRGRGGWKQGRWGMEEVGSTGGGEKGRWGEWEEGRRVGGKGSRWEVGDLRVGVGDGKGRSGESFGGGRCWGGGGG